MTQLPGFADDLAYGGFAEIKELLGVGAGIELFLT